MIEWTSENPCKVMYCVCNTARISMFFFESIENLEVIIQLKKKISRNSNKTSVYH